MARASVFLWQEDSHYCVYTLGGGADSQTSVHYFLNSKGKSRFTPLCRADLIPNVRCLTCCHSGTKGF